jgi:hypothetical protein
MSVPWADERFWVSILANVAGLTRQEAVEGLQELVDVGLLIQERTGGLVRYVANVSEGGGRCGTEAGLLTRPLTSLLSTQVYGADSPTPICVQAVPVAGPRHSTARRTRVSPEAQNRPEDR